MKININNFPFYKIPPLKNIKFTGGPYNFMRRLTDSIQEQNLCKIVPSFLNHDISLYLPKKIMIKSKYVIRLDGLNINSKDENRNFEINILKQSIKNSIGQIYHAKYCQYVHEKFLGKSSSPTALIYNGVPLKIFNPNGPSYRHHLKILNDDFVIICSAKWRRHKRLNEIIKFFNLLATNNKKLKLIVLGENSISSTMQDNKNIFFVGHVKEKSLANWYRSADMYLHLAWIEPSGNAQIEAIGCGLPVLCTNNGGIGETVLNTNSGIVSQADTDINFSLVDYYNPPEPNYDILKEDFEKIYNNIGFYKKNIKYENIDIKKTAREYVSFFEKILGNNEFKKK